METSRSEGSLLNEIHFLTNLIQSHQRAATGPNYEKHVKNTRHRWNPNRSRQTPFKAASTTRQPRRQTKGKNLVYKPPKVAVAVQKSSSLNALATLRPNNSSHGSRVSVKAEFPGNSPVVSHQIHIKTEPLCNSPVASRQIHIKTEPLWDYPAPKSEVLPSNNFPKKQGVGVRVHSKVDTSNRSRHSGSRAAAAASDGSSARIVTFEGGSSSRAPGQRVVLDLQPATTVPGYKHATGGSVGRSKAKGLDQRVVLDMQQASTVRATAAAGNQHATTKASGRKGPSKRERRRFSRRRKAKANVKKRGKAPNQNSVVMAPPPAPANPLFSTPLISTPVNPLFTYPLFSTPANLPSTLTPFTFGSGRQAATGPSSGPQAATGPSSGRQAATGTSSGRVAKQRRRSHRSRYKWKGNKSTPAVAVCRMNTPNNASLKDSATKRKRKKSQSLLSRKGKNGLFKNKVWVPPRNETEVVFITPKPAKQGGEAVDQAAEATNPGEPSKPVRLVGHEKKTKQGNRQWVVAGLARAPTRGIARKSPRTKQKPSPVFLNGVQHPRKLIGHEKKTKQGNRQWVVAGLTPARRVVRKTPRSRLKSSLVTFNGGRYRMDRSGKRLKRLSTSSSQLAGLSPAVCDYLGGVAKNSSVKRMMASRVVKRSKAYVWHARMKKQQDKSKQFCLFFNRFGKCNKGKECPYIHDPDKIAVCTKFLKGTCDKMNGTCLFSHKISKEKMPVCSFFLRGVCTREDCPYLHVSVGRDAKVCPDFNKGYCSRGEKCTMQHTLVCPKFSLTGSCPDGPKCPLRHTKKPKEPLASPSLVKEPSAFKKLRCRHEQVLLSRRDQDDRGMSEAETEDQQEGSKKEKEIEEQVVTIRELDFIPLELNAG